MGTTGLIYAGIAVAWLVYLIPNYLRRRDEASTESDEVDVTDRFSDSVRVIRSGMAPLLDHDLSAMDDCEVSTPLTRRAAIAELGRLERLAASRRRRVLVGLLIMVTGVVAVSAADLLPWWTVAIPSGMVPGFFAVSRFSVAAMRRDLDQRYAEINADSDEATVVLNREQLAGAVADEGKHKIVQPQPEKTPATAALWDPLPITMPTYVSKPLTPRTVRTIDLSAPELSPSHGADVPVTADARPAAEPVPEPDRAVEVAKPEAATSGSRNQNADEAMECPSGSLHGHRAAGA